MIYTLCHGDVLFSKRISMAYDGVTRYVGQFMHLRCAIQDFFRSYILLRFCLSHALSV